MTFKAFRALLKFIGATISAIIKISAIRSRTPYDALHIADSPSQCLLFIRIFKLSIHFACPSQLPQSHNVIVWNFDFTSLSIDASKRKFHDLDITFDIFANASNMRLMTTFQLESLIPAYLLVHSPVFSHFFYTLHFFLAYIAYFRFSG